MAARGHNYGRLSDDEKENKKSLRCDIGRVPVCHPINHFEFLGMMSTQNYLTSNPAVVDLKKKKQILFSHHQFRQLGPWKSKKFFLTEKTINNNKIKKKYKK